MPTGKYLRKPKSRCPYGHELTSATTYTRVKKNRKNGVLYTSRECRTCNNDRNICRKFNITLAQMKNIRDIQNGKCAICERPPRGKRKLHLDHSHDTNIVRGFLCSQCNVGIGMFEDSIALLKSAITYLSKTPPIEIKVKMKRKW